MRFRRTASRPLPTAVLAVAALLLLSAAPTALAVAQDDAGSGADALDDMNQALPVGPGTLAGRIDRSAGDLADWYALDTPNGAVLNVSLRTEALHLGWTLEFRDAASGALLTSTWVDHGWIVLMGSATGPAVVGLVTDHANSTGDDATYEMDILVILPTDLHIERLHVGDAQPLQGVGLVRPVEVAVANRGWQAAEGSHVLVTVRYEHPLPCTRTLVDAWFDLEVDGVASFAAEWDGTGDLGEVDVTARAIHDLDPFPANNEASQRVHLPPLPEPLEGSFSATCPLDF